MSQRVRAGRHQRRWSRRAGRRSPAPMRHHVDAAHAGTGAAARAVACWCRSTCRRSTCPPATRQRSCACPSRSTTPDGAEPRSRCRAPFDAGTASAAGRPPALGAARLAAARRRCSDRRRRRAAIGWACRRCPTAGSCCACSCPRGAAAHRVVGLGASRPTRPRSSPLEHGRRAAPTRSRRRARRSRATELTGTVGGTLNWIGVLRRGRRTASPSTIRSTTSRGRAARRRRRPRGLRRRGLVVRSRRSIRSTARARIAASHGRLDELGWRSDRRPRGRRPASARGARRPRRSSAQTLGLSTRLALSSSAATRDAAPAVLDAGGASTVRRRRASA